MAHDAIYLRQVFMPEKTSIIACSHPCWIIKLLLCVWALGSFLNRLCCVEDNSHLDEQKILLAQIKNGLQIMWKIWMPFISKMTTCLILAYFCQRQLEGLLTTLLLADQFRRRKKFIFTLHFFYLLLLNEAERKVLFCNFCMCYWK